MEYFHRNSPEASKVLSKLRKIAGYLQAPLGAHVWLKEAGLTLCEEMKALCCLISNKLTLSDLYDYVIEYGKTPDEFEEALLELIAKTSSAQELERRKKASRAQLNCLEQQELIRLSKRVNYYCPSDARDFFDDGKFTDAQKLDIFRLLASRKLTIDDVYDLAIECWLTFGAGPKNVKIAVAMRVRYADAIKQNDEKLNRGQRFQLTVDVHVRLTITISRATSA